MEKTKINRTVEEEVIASIKIHVYIALGGMVVPGLRCILVEWEPGDTHAYISFYHNGLVGEPIHYHYECIECEATSMRHPSYKGKQIIVGQGKIVSSPYPLLLPRSSKVVYLKKEPNTEFNEVNTYVPDWGPNVTIRLKVNEALRGKVTGNLREIHLTWHDDNTEALLTFFHNGEVTPEIEKEYEEIFNIATTTSSKWYKEGKKVTPNFIVKKAFYPGKIESEDDVDILYSRKEPFTNLPIGEE